MKNWQISDWGMLTSEEHWCQGHRRNWAKILGGPNSSGPSKLALCKHNHAFSSFFNPFLLLKYNLGPSDVKFGTFWWQIWNLLVQGPPGPLLGCAYEIVVLLTLKIVPKSISPLLIVAFFARHCIGYKYKYVFDVSRFAFYILKSLAR